MAEYTIKDVIIDPDDQRVEVGTEYYFGDNVGQLLHGARTGWKAEVLRDVCKATDEYSPFYNGMSRFSCIIREKEMSYVERQAKWIADNRIKRGDKVRIVREADSREDGWESNWIPYMDEAVGKVGTVSSISSNFRESGIEVSVPDVWPSRYPYFVLEKVEEEHVPYDFEDPDCRALLVGKVVRYKSGGAGGPVMITGFERLEGRGWIAHLGDRNVTDAEELLNHCEHIDGTPCGVEVEDGGGKRC